VSGKECVVVAMVMVDLCCRVESRYTGYQECTWKANDTVIVIRPIRAVSNRNGADMRPSLVSGPRGAGPGTGVET
jgi:hypothetical protein